MAGIVKIEPRDVERTVKSMLHREMRDDIRVTVAYLVKFEVDDETYVNTVIEPWQPMPRSSYDKLVKEVIKNLDAQEKAQEPKNDKEVDNPFLNTGASTEEARGEGTDVQSPVHTPAEDVADGAV